MKKAFDKKIFNKWNWIIIGVLCVAGGAAFLSRDSETQKITLGDLGEGLIVAGILTCIIVPPVLFLAMYLDRKESTRPCCPTCGQELPEENQTVDEYV